MRHLSLYKIKLVFIQDLLKKNTFNQVSCVQLRLISTHYCYILHLIEGIGDFETMWSQTFIKLSSQQHYAHHYSGIEIIRYAIKGTCIFCQRGFCTTQGIGWLLQECPRLWNGTLTNLRIIKWTPGSRVVSMCTLN